MHRVNRCRRYWSTLFAGCFALTSPAIAGAASTRVYAFNTQPNAVYQIGKNGNAAGAAVTSGAGALVFMLDAAAGDRLEIVYDPDTNLQPPAPPIFSSLVSSEACAVATWLPSGDPTVVGYVVSIGARSVAGGQASSYDQSVGSATPSKSICALQPGRYYVAVQAKNYVGMLSAYSAERTVDIVALPVLISMFEAALDGDGVRLSWRVSADEMIREFRVYRRDDESSERVLQALPADAISFLDADVKNGTTYTYVLAAVKAGGAEVRSMPATITTPAVDIVLGQNVPNPFNPTTTISFTLGAPGGVTLEVFDVSGALVTTLFDGHLESGSHSFEWNGTDAGGQQVSSGAYFYTLTVGKQSQSKKMVLLK